MQKEVAEQIGVVADTVHNWEHGTSEPPIEFMPAIIRFLGYEPWPEPVTLPERMQAYRRRRGLTAKAAAQRAGVDEGSWGTWERTGVVPWERYRLMLERLLAETVTATHQTGSVL